METRYADAWTFYRRLRRIVCTCFFAAILELRFVWVINGLIFASTFFVYFMLALWLANWKCPRCQQPFSHGAFLHSLFGGRCFHCKLPKWAVTQFGDLFLRPRFPAGWRVFDE
ncbi:MAG TPA: hypothetical protein VGD78_12640 [Chthoniobacterales bacterium]